MSCKPTYKGIRYNSLEELYRANGANTQQAQQLYSSYLQTTNNPTIEGFKQWNNRQQQINELFESNPGLANAVYEALGFKQSLPELEGTTSDKIKHLFEKNIFVEKGGRKFFKQNQTRLGVIVNVNGIEVPFYQSQGQTGGKTTNWTPFYGNRGAWLIKSSIKNINNGLGIEAIQEMMEYLDKNIPEYLSASDYFTPEQQTILRSETDSFNLGKLQEQGNKNIFPEVALSKKEVGETLSNLNVIKYDLSKAPTESSESFDFVKNIENLLTTSFKQNEITPEQKQKAQQWYSQYLDTIGVTDIGYHHSESDLESFTTFPEGYFPKELKNKGTHYKEADDIVFFVRKPLTEEFMSKRKFTGTWGLKIPNTLQFNAGEKVGEGVHPGIDEGIRNAVDGNYDAVDFGRIRDNKTWSEVVAITNPKNAVKLGSKQDIKGFKEFVLNNPIIQTKVRKNVFDFTPVRLLYKYLNNELDGDDLIIFNNFNNQYVQGGNIEAYLRAWTQRLLQLLDHNLTMSDVGVTTDFVKYFENDNIITDILEDVIEKYNIVVSDLNFRPAEMVMSDVYKSIFERDESMYLIESQGSEYFKNKLSEFFNQDISKENFDLKLFHPKGEVYLKITDKLPAASQNLNIKRNPDFDNTYSRYDEDGNRIYNVPKGAVVVIEDNKEIIYLKDLKQLNKIIKSFDNLKAVIPKFDLKNKIKTNSIIAKTFEKFYGINYNNDLNYDSDWFIRNNDQLLDLISKTRYASWLKSKEFVASRIPAQSMQSFMPMQNIAYMKGTSNDVYVNISQILLTGGDFKKILESH